MKLYPQWMLYKTERVGDRLEKYPVSPLTGRVADAQDPSQWVDYTTALAASRVLACTGLAFVFTESDPFFFIDIDDCLSSAGVWTPDAVALCAAFTGTEIEVSVSGVGLHIFGNGTPLDGYGVKATDSGFDLYTAKRFVAYTGTGDGDPCCHDHTAALQTLQRARMSPRVVAGVSAEWTDGPCEGWKGPVNDDALIRAARGSESAQAAFGDKAGFAVLWDADTDVLGGFFPDSAAGRAFNHSAADSALLTHLAFWTGRDCERMDRLFRRSGLFRDKWDSRPDYRERSILGALGVNRKVLSSDHYRTSAVVEPTSSEAVVVVAGLQMMGVEEQIGHFSTSVYVRSKHRVLVEDGGLVKPSQFKATMGGYIFALDNIGDKSTKDPFEVLTESQALRHVWAHDVMFRPELPEREMVKEEGRRLVNVYVKPDIRVVESDPAPFFNHIRKMIPNDADRNILIAYLAACVQYPGAKIQWCPVIQGIEGNGKTIIINALAYAVGHRYTHIPNPEDLVANGSKFTAWLENKLFIGVEEIRVKSVDAADKLKPFITNKRIEIQGKGADQYTGDNRANFILCSNHKDAVIKSSRDRRYCVFYTAQQDPGDLDRDGMGGAYFPQLYAWLDADGYAAVAYHLQNYEIPAELNPITTLTRAPETSSTTEAIASSLSPAAQEVAELIERGEHGFCGGWVSSFALDPVLDRHRVPRGKWAALMSELGYQLHSALPGGRGLKVVAEGGKPKLYLRCGHTALALHSARLITDAYTKAQTSAGESGPNSPAVVFNRS